MAGQQRRFGDPQVDKNTGRGSAIPSASSRAGAASITDRRDPPVLAGVSPPTAGQ
jgi:hypothetical protein